MNIDMDTNQSNLELLYKEILANLDKIDELELNDEKSMETSSLMSMLVTFKNSYSDKIIKKLDNKSFINGLGKVIVKE